MSTLDSAVDANPISDEELLGRFRPVFDRIAEGAVEREEQRRLPYEEIGWLRDAGFGIIRIPREFGGLGATSSQLFRVLIELGEADSNLPQALRGHCAFVENRLRTRNDASRREWFERIVGGVLIGNAQAERGAETGTTAVLEPSSTGGSWLLTGQKYYSTGTIFADWVITTAKLDGAHVSVMVRTDQPEVTRTDDWDGFGQRMTGSGTTRFAAAPVEAGHVLRLDEDGERSTASVTAFFQMVLLSTLSGIGRAVLRDASEFVRGRTRTFGVPGASSPREDPLVQRVVGRIASLAFSAEELTLAAGRRFDDIDAARIAGAGPEVLDELHTSAQFAVFKAQQIVLPTVLDAATLLFEVGGASATSESRRLDRHWRNARTVAAHNPAILRERVIGDYELNGTVPINWWVKAAEDAAG
jgi:alkylation response protein AidB-like acyl-CoA dehydrogenase